MSRPRFLGCLDCGFVTPWGWRWPLPEQCVVCCPTCAEKSAVSVLRDLSPNPEQQPTACEWEQLEEYPSGARRCRCKVCGCDTVFQAKGGMLIFLPLDDGDQAKHAPAGELAPADPEPATTPLDEWVDGIDLSTL